MKVVGRRGVIRGTVFQGLKLRLPTALAWLVHTCLGWVELARSCDLAAGQPWNCGTAWVQ